MSKFGLFSGSIICVEQAKASPSLSDFMSAVELSKYGNICFEEHRCTHFKYVDAGLLLMNSDPVHPWVPQFSKTLPIGREQVKDVIYEETRRHSLHKIMFMNTRSDVKRWRQLDIMNIRDIELIKVHDDELVIRLRESIDKT